MVIKSSYDLKQKRLRVRCLPFAHTHKDWKVRGVGTVRGKTIRAAQSGTMFHGKSFVVMFYATLLKVVIKHFVASLEVITLHVVNHHILTIELLHNQSAVLNVGMHRTDVVV